MTRQELFGHIDEVCAALGVVDELRDLQHRPSVDEDYKLAWPENQRYSREFFEELLRLANAVREHCLAAGVPC